MSTSELGSKRLLSCNVSLASSTKKTSVRTDKGKNIQRIPSIFTEQAKRVNLEQRSNKSITSKVVLGLISVDCLFP